MSLLSRTLTFLLMIPFIFASISDEVVYFRLKGIDRIQVSPTKQKSEDIYRNFTFLTPSEEISNYIVANGVGTFMNISYANLFLRVSIDHSYLFIVSEYCKNCDRNIFFNKGSIGNALSGDLYGFDSTECWSRSFTTNLDSPYCEINLNYGDDNLVGVLGYDTTHISYTKSFIFPNIIYLTKQDGTLVNSDLNGMFGFGMSDKDGAYGISIFEEFLNNNVMDTPLFAMCLEPLGDGYLYFSAYGNGSSPFDENSIVWFEQTYSYMYTINVPTVSFINKEYSLQEPDIQFSLDTPYLLLAEDIFYKYMGSMTAFLCAGGAGLIPLCRNARSLLEEDGLIMLALKDAKILQEIPPFVLHLRGKGDKPLDITIQKIFGVCPVNSKDYFLASSDTEIPICSMIKLNKINPKRTIVGNIAHTEAGNLYIFDKRKGLLGISQEVLCYDKPNRKNMVLFRVPVAYSLVGQIFVILGFCTLLVLSLNKCDDYFYQEEDREQDDGDTLSFLTQNRSRTDVSDQNISQMR